MLKRYHPAKFYVREYLGYKNKEKSCHFDLVIVFLILLSAVLYVLGTYPLSDIVLEIIHYAEVLIILVFTVEVFLRYWVSEDKKKHFKSVYNWIDILAIIPFWFGLSDLQFLLIFRFFKILRYSEMYLSKHRLYSGKDWFRKLFVTNLLFMVFMIIFVSSGFFYAFENEVNPSVQSFDDALYFILVTVTTVGFGDITPATDLGRLITMFAILGGIIIIPWHISSLLKFLLHDSKKTNVACRSCGLHHHDHDAIHCKHCGEMIYQPHDDNYS